MSQSMRDMLSGFVAAFVFGSVLSLAGCGDESGGPSPQSSTVESHELDDGDSRAR